MTLVVSGSFGVIAYRVVRLRQEIATRMALEATGTGIVRLVMQAGVRLGATGLGIGVVVALLLRGVVWRVL